MKTFPSARSLVCCVRAQKNVPPVKQERAAGTEVSSLRRVITRAATGESATPLRGRTQRPPLPPPPSPGPRPSTAASGAPLAETGAPELLPGVHLRHGALGNTVPASPPLSCPDSSLTSPLGYCSILTPASDGALQCIYHSLWYCTAVSVTGVTGV